MKQLTELQNELKAPKNQFNSFGKYKYRNCEDILEALKPLLLKHSLTLTINDELIEMGGYMVIKATAIITNGKESLTSSAFAGIDPQKKGMDISQTFGSSSSYARKYALNALFLIDDTKDADSQEVAHTPAKKAEKAWLNPNTEQWKAAIEFLKGAGNINQIKSKYNISKENEEKLKEESL